uniref:Uncharacterized protein n=1 Tax=Oryza punctata TaxID=4537 RepID=A0A0E0M0Y5_ORYPU
MYLIISQHIYSLPPTRQRGFGIGQSTPPKPNVNNFQQIGSCVQPTKHTTEHMFKTDDIRLACSAGGQFVEEFNSLTEEICRDVEEKFNAYILSKGSKPTFAQQHKPINLELSANEKEVAMLDFSRDTEAFVLPDEFRTKEVDEHQVDGARNLENMEEMLDAYKRTNQDMVQACIWATDKKCTTGEDAAKGIFGRVSNRSESVEELGGQWHTSNWQKKQLHKLSAEKLRERGMAWVHKGSVQVRNEKYTKIIFEAKKEKGVKRCALNQRFVSNHHDLWSTMMSRTKYLRLTRNFMLFY